MSYFTDDNGVIENFMAQRACKSKTMRTDGQSLWSFDTRIAEHVPDGNGRAATLVYDYTYSGGAFISKTTSGHVHLAKKAVPRQNCVSVSEAQKHGLCPLVESRNDTPRSTR